MSLNPFVSIIRSLSVLISKINCRWKCQLCDCDCKMSPQEIEDIMHEATMMYLENCRNEDLTKMTLSQI